MNSTTRQKNLSTRRPVHRGPVVDLGIETVDLPGGGRVDLEVVRHPGGAAAVAVDRDGQVCLVRQFRHAAGGWIWEVRAGKRDPGEGPDATARRELEEEAGVRAARWDPLGAVLPTPGFCDEVVHLYLARDLQRVPVRHGAHERIEVHWVPFPDAVDRAASGALQDAKTVVALLRAARVLGGAG